ncbi:MAG: hypothetical protein M3297_01425 [Thermoproteota archaeon]|jgi:hypothetical protein|nr:hypothetical protein [Thermoproteota archaeon]
MGAVFRPKDLGRDNQKVIENAVRDFSPDTRDNVIGLLNSWEGKKSASKLSEILGQKKSEELLRNIAEDGRLSEDERLRLRNMFRESLTFD